MEWPPGLQGLTCDYISQLCFALLIFASLRSRRLEVKGERENGRAQGRHYLQAPATQAILVNTTSPVWSLWAGPSNRRSFKA